MSLKLPKKIHFVSVGLEQKRVWSYLTRQGMDKVILVYFVETRNGMVERTEGLSAVLEHHRDLMKEKLSKNGIDFEILELPIMKTDIQKICSKLHERIREIRRDDPTAEIILGVGTGHTTYKLACFLLASLDSDENLKIRYFETSEYLDSRLDPIIRDYKKTLDKGLPEDEEKRHEIYRDFFEGFKEISEFASEGWTGSASNIIDVKRMPRPSLTDVEIQILKYLVENGVKGKIGKVKYLAEFLLEKQPSWYSMPKSAGKENKGNEIRSITNNLRRTHLKALEMKDCVKIEKEGQRTTVEITDFGRLRLKVLGETPS